MKTVADLMELAAELNTEEFTVFVEFYGHVNKVEMRIFIDGWSSGSEAKITVDALVTEPYKINSLYDVLASTYSHKNVRSA